MKQGWVSLHRSILHHWTWKKSKKKTAFEAWVYLILRANHKSDKIQFDSELITIERGSMITSILQLSAAWNWSQERVKCFLTSLQNDLMITFKTERRKTTISIVNYDSYQGGDCQNRELTENSPRTDRELTETNNNTNNKNNTNNNSLNARAREMPQVDGFQVSDFHIIEPGTIAATTPTSGSIGTYKLKFSAIEWEALRVNVYFGDTRTLTQDVLAATDHLLHTGGVSHDPVAYMRSWKRRKSEFERPKQFPKQSAQDSQRDSIANLAKLYGGES